MLLLSRRQTRAAMSAAAGAAVYLAASEIGTRKLKMTGLFVLASASMAGMVTARASAKAYSVEQRLNAHVAATAAAVNLQANGGTIGGTLSMGSHDITNIAHIAPALFGPGGTRANFGYLPDSHQSTAPGSYSSSYEQATTTRLNNLIDQVSNVSDRCDYILGTLLTSANIAY